MRVPSPSPRTILRGSTSRCRLPLWAQTHCRKKDKASRTGLPLFAASVAAWLTRRWIDHRDVALAAIVLQHTPNAARSPRLFTVRIWLLISAALRRQSCSADSGNPFSQRAAPARDGTWPTNGDRRATRGNQVLACCLRMPRVRSRCTVQTVSLLSAVSSNSRICCRPRATAIFARSACSRRSFVDLEARCP